MNTKTLPKCPACNKEFKLRNKFQVYCSVHCRPKLTPAEKWLKKKTPAKKTPEMYFRFSYLSN